MPWIPEVERTALAVPAGTSGFTVAAFEAGSRESCDIIY